ncbi:hypothetical protein S40293_11181 [Stachybotrys chartarum IBT 40293]|nr:hypothetical protein S40293_11181 [Stachybotrys chartarum IBT 40293]KFA79828.1 hypothetical protein S40288_10499 [Stachybotrys chartarum IBT 40288]
MSASPSLATSTTVGSEKSAEYVLCGELPSTKAFASFSDMDDGENTTSNYCGSATSFVDSIIRGADLWEGKQILVDAKATRASFAKLEQCQKDYIHPAHGAVICCVAHIERRA